VPLRAAGGAHFAGPSALKLGWLREALLRAGRAGIDRRINFTDCEFRAAAAASVARGRDPGSGEVSSRWHHEWRIMMRVAEFGKPKLLMRRLSRLARPLRRGGATKIRSAPASLASR